MFNPERLVIARKRRKLTSKELSGLTGISVVTLSRLEKGNNEPEPATVGALAEALKFPKEFFYGEDTGNFPKDSVSFRSLTSMTSKERDSALSAGELACFFSDWIISKFNLPKTDILDLGYEQNPDCAARSLREYWGLGEKPISNMIKLLESKGIRVFSLSEDTKNVDAFSFWRDNVPYMFLNTEKSAERRRFDAAHELGHLVLHKHGGPGHAKETESDANSFASSFLMPYADIISNIPIANSLNRLICRKKRWGVSIAALAYRLHKIGVLSDWQYRMFAIEINTKGFRVNEPNSIVPEISTVWPKILGELWKERITVDHIANILHFPINEIENLIFSPITQTHTEFKTTASMPRLSLCT